MSRKVMQQALDFVEFCWRDVQLNEFAETMRFKVEQSLREELEKTDAGWLPIDTAPKFSDEIDIWANGCRYACCDFGKPTYGKELGWIYESRHDSDGPVYEIVKNPTHWMPLPKPPVDPTSE